MRTSGRVLIVALVAILAGPEAWAAVHEGLAGTLTVLDAALLGLVEGVTEYLPVSSTGHLILTQRALGIPASPEANALAICIQGGAITAVLVLYRARVATMAKGLMGRDATGLALALAVIVAFVPAAVLGLAAGDWIQQHLFGLWPVVLAWFVGGVAILLVARGRRGRPVTSGSPLEAITPRMAVLIGLAQCLALWPGTSRSLVTIVGGLVVGLSLPAALEFSFLLGVVTLGAATVYEAARCGAPMVEAYGPTTLAVGFLTATVSAAIAVRWLVGWIRRHGLSVFGVYRVALALVVAALLLAGVFRAT